MAENLLLKQAVVVVPPCQDQFISRLFLVEKKDGSFRPVVNLKPLNGFIQKEHLKMEGASMIKDLLQPGDWMCSLDLKDAYLTVPIAKEHCKYLCILWDGKVFKFTCLPFVFCSTLRVFTKLLCSVMAYLCSQGVRTIIYLDDILVMYNQSKPQTIPARQIQFLGYLVDSSHKKRSRALLKVASG